jgi:hypothetical protein
MSNRCGRTWWRSHSVHIAVLVCTHKPSYDRIHYRHDDDGVFLYAFDLIELDGDDLRRNPLNRAQDNTRQRSGANGAGLTIE